MNMDLRKLFTYFKSMKFGILLLILIIILSLIGTFRADIYNSILFGALFIMLTLNLIMCSIVRFKNIIIKFRANPRIDTMELVAVENIDSSDSVSITVDKIFRKYGFYGYIQDKTSNDIYYSVKNKAGYFGSWLLHLGILLIIIYYAYGHITYYSESIYGIPGTIQQLKGTEYKVKINDFKIDYDDNGVIQQYTSNIEFLDDTGESLKSAYTALNKPMRFEGYAVYQTAYGWASRCNVTIAGKNILEDVIYEKTSLNLPHDNITIYFNAFYPDFVASSQGFTTVSDQLNNPVVLYSLFYRGEIVKMDIVPMGEVVKWNQYEFVLHSPERYTYLDINRMKGQIGAAIGALSLTIGIILVFYLKPNKMIIQLEDGKLHVYRVIPQVRSSKTNYQKEKGSYVR
jgi:cytochrome c biogenesis protein